MTPHSGSGPAKDPQRLREEADQTRAELGETVAQLAAKADVKAKAHRKATETKEQAHYAATVAAERGRENRGPLIAAGAVAVVVMVWVLGKRHGKW
ncbi:DUF3618 domain-containing protein [Streptomyces sp. JJ66]|uniref:DUF3618 domain-containing protein n=1 Tax=Streptomyces sp. JJ66 TaxID=2803843 RepID=UPI001C57E27D|nr:DUF3618 domain-containing protein [Streptomyces sp. JJ66]MBW1603334.1 DUF3618 domain-containing protein [Streptomyces sp. JJ66]